MATCAAVRDALEPTEADGAAHLVVDLSQLTFMDSSGLHLLVATQEAAARRGIRFSLIRGPAIVARALELTGLDDRFEVLQH